MSVAENLYMESLKVKGVETHCYMYTHITTNKQMFQQTELYTSFSWYPTMPLHKREFCQNAHLRFNFATIIDGC